LSLVCISGKDFVRGIKRGCINLEHNKDSVNLLNVFPVPDGDTGTNMYLTLLSAVKEGENCPDYTLDKIAKAVSRGSLMGARGNSGVILSQIFRGIAKIFEGKKDADAVELALALKAGSDTAYKAVMKPVEGTILTIIREIADKCEIEARKNKDIIAILFAGIQEGRQTLKKTPNMLPVLKEAGVVDAGGQGLLYFLEGLVEGLAREKDIPLDTYKVQKLEHTKEEILSELGLDIEFQYCTEVLIKGNNLNSENIKDHLEPLGDSMLVIGGDDMVKVHIHSNHPGKVLESCLQWGSLSDIKINNMVEEAHEHLTTWQEETKKNEPAKEIGLVAVGVGDGVIEILKGLGVDIVVEGGQTMNPSTEELLDACTRINAKSIIILPNNSNVIMAAKQAGKLSDKKVAVVPTRSVMQAITALIAYDSMGDIDGIYQAMAEEIKHVKYAEVTYAVRDSSLNGLEIKEGDILGIIEDEIKLIAKSKEEAVELLLQYMKDNESELITFFYSADIDEDRALDLREKIANTYPDCEVEVHYGGQPHYSYIISVE